MSNSNLAREKLNYGVNVVTSKMDNKINGLTAAWVMQVSHSPLLIAVSIGHTRETYNYIKHSNFFAVNILSENGIELAKLFGFNSGRDVNKFENVEYFTSKYTGCPILKDACAYLDCEVVNSFKTGDHDIFVGKVVDSKILNDIPSMFFNREDFF